MNGFKDKLLSVSLVVIIILSLTGCGGQVKEEQVGFSSVTEGVGAAVDELRDIFGQDSIPSVEQLLNQLEDLSFTKEDSIPGSADIEKILSFVYEKNAVTFDSDHNDLFGMLPHTTLLEREGSCMGVSMLLLMLGEKFDIPLYGVVIPGHFFVRYDSGKKRRNIEPNREGINHPDSYYRRRYGIDDSSRHSMQNLTVNQSLGVLYFNIGNFCRQKQRYARAEEFYRRSVKLFPCYAESWGNLAILYLQSSRPEFARKAFEKAYACDPKLRNLAYNFAAFEFNRGKYRKAADLFLQALRNGNHSGEVLDGLTLAYQKLGKADSAESIIALKKRTHKSAGENSSTRNENKAIDHIGKAVVDKK